MLITILCLVALALIAATCLTGHRVGYNSGVDAVCDRAIAAIEAERAAAKANRVDVLDKLTARFGR